MEKEMYKYQTVSSVKQDSSPVFESVHYQKNAKSSLQQKLLPLFILIFLGGWISLCFLHGTFLGEAIVCSAIISCLLFFRVAEYSEEELEDKE